MPKIKYRLGLDLGANSLGWCVYRLDAQNEPDKLVRLGARIFADGRDPKTLASRAAERRQARQKRRRRDRVLKRRHKLMQALIRFGLMPADDAERKAMQTIDPYALRAKGLDERLELNELGRALYHLTRKRGFRSSRKEARSDDAAKEEGKVRQAIAALRARVEEAGCRTVGEYLARQHAVRAPVRARRSSDGGYVLYLQRAMVEEEFDALWNAQREHHPEVLTDAARESLRDILLFQRRLRPVEAGRCVLEPTEYRARLCAPLQQRFRMLQELNHLRVGEGIGERALTLEERNRMLAVLEKDPGPKPVSFAKLAKAAGLRTSDFNFGRDNKRTGLKGDAVAARFSAETALGPAWAELSSAQQYALSVLATLADQVSTLESALLALPAISPACEDILRGIFDSDERDAVARALHSLPLRLDQAQARCIAKFNLPDDYGSLSLKALERIVPELEREVVTYDEAVRRAGYMSHSQLHTGEIFDQLPYYGLVLKGYTAPTPTAKHPEERQYGKIPNPTVHIGLNQLRLLVNALIKRYGRPHQIVIELTREFGASGTKRAEIMRQQKENQERNAAYDEQLLALGVRPNRENRQKLQLWEELGKDDAMDRFCIYSGQHLSKAMLFSDEVEIDHVLPFSRSLHDGIGNKLLCIRQSNRDKGNRTPFEAWGHTEQWEGIVERAERLPAHKRRLFREHALEEFLGDGDFLARHLTDTAYLGRAAKQYLTYVCPQHAVWVSSGKLTGMIRAKFGLNRLLSEDASKNRNDHRHHALDAAVVGLCSRSLIQRMANAAARAEQHGENRLLEHLDLPWPSYREELASALDAVVVSHKPDHGKQAALHNDTHYGWRGPPDGRGNPLVGYRRTLDSIKNAKDAESIADKTLREEVVQLLIPLSSQKEIKAALKTYSDRTGIRRVLCEERLSVIPIRDRRNGQPYRYVKGDSNYCYEIFRKPNGRWDGEVISTFEANQRGFVESATSAQNGMPLVMRLHKDDVLALELDGTIRYMRIAKFSEGMIALVHPNEANVDARTRDKSSGLKYYFKSPSTLQALRARLVGIGILGFVNDPGFKE
ncbi:MAG: type II CRISPR RNA-guided endonuclease Cas9 [Stenotrophomonas sp.]|nr:type II CRISPR RNA-guided endonuclease Cas9 [Xanthomonadales bacterium]MBN8769270.1 type II CRISPR RNA-guided endonuclease Cas9 [Stenotrophomonas sp.]